MLPRGPNTGFLIFDCYLFSSQISKISSEFFLTIFFYYYYDSFFCYLIFFIFLISPIDFFITSFFLNLFLSSFSGLLVPALPYVSIANNSFNFAFLIFFFTDFCNYYYFLFSATSCKTSSAIIFLRQRFFPLLVFKFRRINLLF